MLGDVVDSITNGWSILSTTLGACVTYAVTRVRHTATIERGRARSDIQVAEFTRDFLMTRLHDCEVRHSKSEAEVKELTALAHALDGQMLFMRWHIDEMKRALKDAGIDIPEPPKFVTDACAFPLTLERAANVSARNSQQQPR